jgi:hypothetical protein
VNRREELEAICFAIGGEIKKEMDDKNSGPPIGFALLMYDFGPGGFLAYCGNGDREGTIRLLREHLKHLEGRTN